MNDPKTIYTMIHDSDDLDQKTSPRHWFYQECITPQSVQRLIQLCLGSWSSVIGFSDVMRVLHTSARPVSRQGTIVFDPRVPATPRVPLRCVRYYDAKIRLRLDQDPMQSWGPGVAHSGGYVLLVLCNMDAHTHTLVYAFLLLPVGLSNLY